MAATGGYLSAAPEVAQVVGRRVPRPRFRIYSPAPSFLAHALLATASDEVCPQAGEPYAAGRADSPRVRLAADVVG